jgi:hypothetical protein
MLIIVDLGGRIVLNQKAYYHKFEAKDYPDTLKLAVDFLWENGERKYETLMFRQQYEGRELNIKY